MSSLPHGVVCDALHPIDDHRGSLTELYRASAHERPVVQFNMLCSGPGVLPTTSVAGGTTRRSRSRGQPTGSPVHTTSPADRSSPSATVRRRAGTTWSVGTTS